MPSIGSGRPAPRPPAGHPLGRHDTTAPPYSRVPHPPINVRRFGVQPSIGDRGDFRRPDPAATISRCEQPSRDSREAQTVRTHRPARLSRTASGSRGCTVPARVCAPWPGRAFHRALRRCLPVPGAIPGRGRLRPGSPVRGTGAAEKQAAAPAARAAPAAARVSGRRNRRRGQLTGTGPTRRKCRGRGPEE
jgi:hypothetical protein